MSGIITKAGFGMGQQDDIAEALAHLIQTLTRVAPQLGPQFLSGGILEIKCLAGAHLKFGFEPQRGGLVLPDGIRPMNGGNKA